MTVRTETPTSLFVSHGAPNLVLHASPARDFLAGLGQSLAQPRAILVASAHWETTEPHVGAAPLPETIHDFQGFEPELHDFQYLAKGSPEIAEEVVELLSRSGISAHIDPQRGLDHGAWVPLALLAPKADIPVLQLSVQPNAGPAHHLALGRALAPLTEREIVVLGSGSLTHNLNELFGEGYAPDAPAPDWVIGFGEWIHEHAEAGDIDALIDYRARAPHAARNHPSEEHLLPFFVALGAAGDLVRATRIHSSHSYGVLQMDAYAFDGASKPADPMGAA